MAILILFDFDGTIADSLEVLFSIYKRLSFEFGYPVIQDKKELMNKSPAEFFAMLKIPKFKFPFVVRRVREEMRKELKSLCPIKGIKEELITLKDKYTLGIVTSNSTENVKEFLKRNDIEFFKFVLSTGIFGKADTIKRIMAKQKLSGESVIYVGDEVRDIQAARAAK